MATSSKANALAKDLYDKLSLRADVAGLDIALGTDSDGNYLISIGAGSIGGQNAKVKVLPESWPEADDALGNAALQYVPTMIQVVTELSATAGVTLVTGANLLWILGECMKTGAKVEWYMSSNGDSPDADDIAAAKLKGTFDPNPFHKLTGAGQ